MNARKMSIVELFQILQKSGLSANDLNIVAYYSSGNRAWRIMKFDNEKLNSMIETANSANMSIDQFIKQKMNSSSPDRPDICWCQKSHPLFGIEIFEGNLDELIWIRCIQTEMSECNVD